jgi:glycosyltransferase involved in cell wall biosynthesis
VFDDASSDTTVELCEKFAADAPFPVRLTVNPAPLGAAQNRARAIAACSSTLIAPCDQDDVWHEDKLAHMEAALTGAGPTALAFCDGVVVDERRRPLGVGLWESFGFDERRQRRVALNRWLAFEELLGRNYAAGPATLFCAPLRDVALPVPDGIRADFWFALVAAATSRVVGVPEPLLEYRQSSGQQTGAGVAWSQRVRRGVVNSLPYQVRGLVQSPSPMEYKRTRYAPLYERLTQLEASDYPPRRECLDRVEERIVHWRTRAGLPRRRRERIPLVRAELASGRYRQYSRGVWAALADLTYPVRSR